MSYQWSLSGHLEKPICKISLNQLLGEVEIITKMVKYPHYIPVLTSLTYSFCKDYRIATHKIESAFEKEKDPGKHTKTVYGVSVFDNFGNLFCLSQDKYTFMEPDYRGRGIGGEVLAELYVAYPWIMEKRLVKSENRLYTPAGIKSVKIAYNLMIERGAILGA